MPLHTASSQQQPSQLGGSCAQSLIHQGAGRQVERLTKFCDSAAFFCRPDFVQARGVRYLVELATSAGSNVDAVSSARSLALCLGKEKQ